MFKREKGLENPVFLCYDKGILSRDNPPRGRIIPLTFYAFGWIANKRRARGRTQEGYVFVYGLQSARSFSLAYVCKRRVTGGR